MSNATTQNLCELHFLSFINEERKKMKKEIEKVSYYFCISSVSELADANVKTTHPHKTSPLTFHEKQAVHLSVTEKSFKFMVKAVISHPRPPPTFLF